MKNISMSIQKLARMIDTIYEDELQDSPLSRGQYPYILYLFDNDGSNQYDISRDLFIDKTTVAKALKKLEKSKIIYRKSDARDKRKVNVHLTSYGKELHDEVNAAMVQIYDIFSTNVDINLLSKLNKLVDVFVQELDIIWCDIKNYKRKSTYSIATTQDMKQLDNRNIYRFEEDEILFVSRFGSHVLNWLGFIKESNSSNIIVNRINFHYTSDIIINGMDLIRAFEDWYYLNYSGDIIFRILENEFDYQKLLHKNSYLFYGYKNIKDKRYYYYKKQR